MLLEAVNSLAGAFVVTELALRDGKLKDNRLTRIMLGATLAANVLLSSVTAWVASAVSANLAAGVSWTRESAWWLIAATATPVRLLLHHAGTAAMITAVVVALVAVAGAGLLLQSGRELSRLHAGLLAAFAVAFFVTLRVFGLDAAAGRHEEATRALIALCAFLLLAYFDVRRFKPGVRPLPFLRDVAVATAFVLPMVPCIAVAFSTVLFLTVSILETVGIDPHILNSVIYVGTIYGPFGVIYFEAKRRCLAAGILPVSTSDTARRSGVPRVSKLVRD